MPRPLDDLGPDFDRRWRQAPAARRRELMAELRDLYFLLDEEGPPLLAPAPAPGPRPGAAAQGSLFGETATARPAADNPFLPRSVLARLQESQHQANAGLRDLMGQVGAPLPPPSHEQVDLERELRLKLGPVVESLIEAHLETMRRELRVRLRAEMDRLIAAHVRK